MKNINEELNKSRYQRILQAQANGLRSRIKGRRRVDQITEHQWWEYLKKVKDSGISTVRSRGVV